MNFQLQYINCLVHGWQVTPVTSYSEEVNPRLTKCPLKTNGHFANLGLTSLVKEATVHWQRSKHSCTVYPKKYAHGFVVLCFVVVMQSFIMNSHEVFIHIHQGCFAGTGAIVRLPQCQWSKPDGYGEISQCITTTKHSKAKTVCIFLGIYCTLSHTYTILCIIFTVVNFEHCSYLFLTDQWIQV